MHSQMVGKQKPLGTIPCVWVVALTLMLKGINNGAMPNCGNLDFDLWRGNIFLIKNLGTSFSTGTTATARASTPTQENKYLGD